jgi:hypothetical protein
VQVCLCIHAREPHGGIALGVASHPLIPPLHSVGWTVLEC